MVESYTIIKYRDFGFSLREVHYDTSGVATISTEPAVFVCSQAEGRGSLLASLEKALADARKQPSLDESTSYAEVQRAGSSPQRRRLISQRPARSLLLRIGSAD